jgi:chemotaxis protein methyltransferase CheR
MIHIGPANIPWGRHKCLPCPLRSCAGDGNIRPGVAKNGTSDFSDDPELKSIMAVTYFFRDCHTLELLIQRALPTLCGQASIDIWDAGCANGAEPYTLAMLLREEMTDRVFEKVRICATDVDPDCGPQIAAGIYAKHEIERIPQSLRQLYFQAIGAPGYVQVVDEVRDKVSFMRHDLLSLEPPRTDFSLIVCKNVVNEFDEEQRRQVFRMFHRAMLPNGFLATEHTQKMPEGAESLFEPISRYAQVYRRLDAADGLQSHVEGPHAPGIRATRDLQNDKDIVGGRRAATKALSR